MRRVLPHQSFRLRVLQPMRRGALTERHAPSLRTRIFAGEVKDAAKEIAPGTDVGRDQRVEASPVIVAEHDGGRPAARIQSRTCDVDRAGGGAATWAVGERGRRSAGKGSEARMVTKPILVHVL